MRITSITMAETAKGAPYKQCSLDSEISGKDRFNVFQFHGRYADCSEGAEFNAEDFEFDGKYLNLIDANKKPSSGNTSITKAQNIKREDIKDAQERKNDSIMISSTARDATLMVTHFLAPNTPEDVVKDKWKEWREFLIKQWDKPNDSTYSEPF